MISLCRNIQGLGSLRTSRTLHLLVQRYKPALIFLSKTRFLVTKLQNLRISLNMDGVFSVDCMGKSGGLRLFWDDSVDVNIISFTKWHIDYVVTAASVDPWCFTRFYGNLDSS